MTKKLLSVLLALAMLLCLVPVTVSAMEIKIDLTVVGQAELTIEVESGDSIDNVKYIIEEKRAIPLLGKHCIITEKRLRTGAHWQITISKKKAHWFCS